MHIKAVGKEQGITFEYLPDPKLIRETCSDAGAGGNDRQVEIGSKNRESWHGSFRDFENVRHRAERREREKFVKYLPGEWTTFTAGKGGAREKIANFI